MSEPTNERSNQRRSERREERTRPRLLRWTRAPGSSKSAAPPLPLPLPPPSYGPNQAVVSNRSRRPSWAPVAPTLGRPELHPSPGLGRSLGRSSSSSGSASALSSRRRRPLRVHQTDDSVSPHLRPEDPARHAIRSKRSHPSHRSFPRFAFLAGPRAFPEQETHYCLSALKREKFKRPSRTVASQLVSAGFTALMSNSARDHHRTRPRPTDQGR